MRLYQNPLYRKLIVPWWDSELACALVLMFMFAVFSFGVIGVTVANDHLEYRSYIWVPAALVVLSAGVILSTTVRLIRRYLNMKIKS